MDRGRPDGVADETASDKPEEHGAGTLATGQMAQSCDTYPEHAWLIGGQKTPGITAAGDDGSAASVLINHIRWQTWLMSTCQLRIQEKDDWLDSLLPLCGTYVWPSPPEKERQTKF